MDHVLWGENTAEGELGRGSGIDYYASDINRTLH